MALRTTNPSTDEVVEDFTELTDPEIDQKLAAAQTAFLAWRQTSFEDRAKLMHQAAVVLREQKSQLVETMATEMGKTKAGGEAEVEKCAITCDYYADNAAAFLAQETIATDASSSYVRFDPIGVVLAVMPWNFPLWQVFRFVAPALMAGNVGVLKHASNVQRCGQAIEDVLKQAGFLEGVFLNLAIGSSKVEAIIRDDRIRAVTLTGSEYAGSQVAKVAGETIKKTVLELGGSDPFIVLADADPTAAAETALLARLQANAGQSCVAAKRFIVEAPLVDDFVAALKTAVAKLTIGDPLDPATDVGPLSSQQTLDDVTKQVNKTVEMGAELIYGGEQIGDKGFFYRPAIVRGVKKGMPLYDEEVFGPAWAVISVKDSDEAVAVANDSDYGLGATIFSPNTAKAEKLAAKIESGAVFINKQVTSDARLPFGGVKNSGYGRELSHYGIKEFVNVKTVWVK